MLLNLKCVLLCFQAVFGLNVKLVKLDGGDEVTRLTDVFSCKRKELLIKYLGLPLGPIIKI